MKRMANISVIIPCYNVSAYIDRCLTSITSQTIGIENLEIICIDDASTDDTLSKLQSWEQKYPEQIMLIPCSQNGRQGTARNIGLQYASSDWVTFLDSDDWVEPDYLAKMYPIACQTNCDVVVCRHLRDTSTSLTYLKEKATKEPNKYMVIDSPEKRKTFLIMKSMEHLAWGKLIRTSLLKEYQILFPENLTYEDTYWGMLLHLYTEKVFFLEEKLYHYFVNTQSTVLQTGSDHHLDLLTVQSLLWKELAQRNMFELYQDALTYDFLHSCYLRFLKIIVLRYERPSYSLFLLLKEFVLIRIPDYKQNPYLLTINQSEFHKLLFEALSLPISQEQFLELANYIKAIGL